MSNVSGRNRLAYGFVPLNRLAKLACIIEATFNYRSKPALHEKKFQSLSGRGCTLLIQEIIQLYEQK